MAVGSMAHQAASKLSKFRDRFTAVPKDILQWFPGHMGKGLKQMQQKLKMVDCVIEVHDARIPLSGRNPNFHYTVSSIKPHILVLNKKDLTDMRSKSLIEEKLKQSGVNHVLFTNCKDPRDRGVKQVMNLATELIASSNRFNRQEENEFCMMIIGVPNVGKSSLINVLRNKYLHKANAAPVGAVAGITRSVQQKIKVSTDPLVYLLDTPGILAPNVQDVETGLRLALCASLQDHLVGEEVIADYLLYWLNKNNNLEYLKLMGLTEPTDNIGTVLFNGALKLGKTLKIRNHDNQYVQCPDLVAAAKYMIKAFRRGDLGLVMMDKDRISL